MVRPLPGRRAGRNGVLESAEMQLFHFSSHHFNRRTWTIIHKRAPVMPRLPSQRNLDRLTLPLGHYLQEHHTLAPHGAEDAPISRLVCAQLSGATLALHLSLIEPVKRHL